MSLFMFQLSASWAKSRSMTITSWVVLTNALSHASKYISSDDGNIDQVLTKSCSRSCLDLSKSTLVHIIVRTLHGCSSKPCNILYMIIRNPFRHHSFRTSVSTAKWSDDYEVRNSEHVLLRKSGWSS